MQDKKEMRSAKLCIDTLFIQYSERVHVGVKGEGRETDKTNHFLHTFNVLILNPTTWIECQWKIQYYKSTLSPNIHQCLSLTYLENQSSGVVCLLPFAKL